MWSQYASATTDATASSVLTYCVLANSFLLQVGMQGMTSAVKPTIADYIPWRYTGQISFIMDVLHILGQFVFGGGRNNEGKYPKHAMPC